MAMGRRRREEQGTFWVAAADLPQSGGHPFYEQLNNILDQEGFDAFAEERRRWFHADKMGRPSPRPAVYFRMLLIGYFEGIDATTLEANAALRSIVRRDTNEGYQEFLTRLAKESGIETPTRADLTGALEALPTLTGDAPDSERQPLAATGTNNARAELASGSLPQNVSTQFPQQLGDEPRRNPSTRCNDGDTDGERADKRKSVPNVALGEDVQRGASESETRPRGFEPPTYGLGNRCRSRVTAEPARTCDSASSCTPSGTPEIPGGDPELALIVSSWSRLPEPIRAGIVAMVKAASPTTKE
jgi:hypothetical protein